jgi:hypothetical protein
MINASQWNADLFLSLVTKLVLQNSPFNREKWLKSCLEGKVCTLKSVK